MLEFGYGDRGLMNIRAAGHYYQRVHDFSRPASSDEGEEARTRAYYDLAYQLPGTKADVAIVGAGAGNDVAAALRGGATHVSAIEIDPAIQRAGMFNHPEHPYSNPRVHAVLDDARSFLRNTDQRFDLIVYGLLDSHALLSHSSLVRLDSYVYTVQALREARSRLKPGGRVILSFSIPHAIAQPEGVRDAEGGVRRRRAGRPSRLVTMARSSSSNAKADTPKCRPRFWRRTASSSTNTPRMRRSR
jgi:spermidine synthase